MEKSRISSSVPEKSQISRIGNRKIVNFVSWVPIREFWLANWAQRYHEFCRSFAKKSEISSIMCGKKQISSIRARKKSEFRRSGVKQLRILWIRGIKIASFVNRDPKICEFRRPPLEIYRSFRQLIDKFCCREVVGASLTGIHLDVLERLKCATSNYVSTVKFEKLQKIVTFWYFIWNGHISCLNKWQIHYSKHFSF